MWLWNKYIVFYFIIYLFSIDMGILINFGFSRLVLQIVGVSPALFVQDVVSTGFLKDLSLKAASVRFFISLLLFWLY
jgi:hypothetical protein